MHLYIKILKGSECEIAVSPSHKISEVKEIISMQIGIPTDEQKLVFKGKTLADDKRLSEYSIGEGAKLFLVQQKSSTVNTPCTPMRSPTDQFSTTTSTRSPDDQFSTAISTDPLWDKLHQLLQRHFTSQDARKVLHEFQKDFNRSLTSLSLDDIERLASFKLMKDQPMNNGHPMT